MSGHESSRRRREHRARSRRRRPHEIAIERLEPRALLAVTATDLDPAFAPIAPVAPDVVAIPTPIRTIAAPLAWITSPGGKTNDATPTVAGIGRRGDTVILHADGAPVGSALVGRGGRWSITSAALSQGTHGLVVRALTPKGVLAGPSPRVTIDIKTTKPPAPTIGLAPQSDTGTVGDMRTSDMVPLLTGRAESAQSVRIYVDVVLVAVVNVIKNAWHLRMPLALPAGTYLRSTQISATATDAYGNTSPTTTATLVTDTRSLDTLFRDYCSGIARTPAERAYAMKAFEGCLWGGSFAWFYSRQQRQAYAAAGPRGVSVPLNSFYVEPAVSAESTGLITPNVNVLYAETWLQVRRGRPVVVHFPAPNADDGHFMSLQVGNSASETIATFSSFPDAPADAAIPKGGDILFRAADDTATYPGDFVHTVAVNTEVVFAAGRTLTGVGLPADNPFSESRAAELAARFVAAEYSAYVANGQSMAGLTNASSTATDAATLAQLIRVSSELKGLHFWEMFGEALVQSPLPTTGPGSETDWQGRTPRQYLQTFKPLGLSKDGWSREGLSARQLQILGSVADRAHTMFIDFLGLADRFPSSAWSSVPSNLGDYPNDPIGYLERDVAHLANLPNFAIYPTLSRDSDGALFKGRDTYVMVLPASSLPSTPPLASNAKANSDGFWAFNVYDTNFNATTSLPGYLEGVTRVRPFMTPPTISNPNNAGGVPNISISSLRTPGSFGSTAQTQYRVEANGDVILILGPTRPKDSRYWNNWLPTPVVTYQNPTLPNASGRFIRDDQFTAMLRVYTPSVYNAAGEARLLSQATPGPQQWIIPKIHKAPGLTAVARIEQADVLARFVRGR